jgi:hypothetical protein
VSDAIKVIEEKMDREIKPRKQIEYLKGKMITEF